MSIANASRHRRLLMLVAGLNAAVLILTAGGQIYDTNFYSLWEATALLAGDHPYRDFFEWGIPLQALVSVCAQVLVGNRLIGEFAVQWLGIIAGAVISCHLGLRLSGSVAASFVTLPLLLALIANTAIYHYPKLLLYPLGLWVIWRYMDAPVATRAGLVGLVVAIAFLFRHDHGVYLAGVAGLAFVLTPPVAAGPGNPRRAWRDIAIFAATAAAVLAPWLILVQASEGLPEYVEARMQRYGVGLPYSNPYASLLTMNPLRPLTPEPPPPPEPGVVDFAWRATTPEPLRARVVEEYGLGILEGPDANSRWRYAVPNRHEPRLLGLLEHVDDAHGPDWGRLSERRWPLPRHADAMMWLQQVSLLVPVLLLVAAALALLRSRIVRTAVPVDTFHVVVGAALLAIVDWRLFREPGYATAVAPLTAALGTRLLARPFRWPDALWSATIRAVVVGMMVVTMAAALVSARPSHIFTPSRLIENLPDVFAELFASPPIDGFAPREEVFAHTQSSWNEEEVDAVRVLMRYVHECSAPGDRVLVTGQTPFQVGYYVERPIAGGHLLWHEKWRSDRVREQESLDLFRRQSVPFAYSTHDPVLDDMKSYPRIREYLLEHYVELGGSRGRVLVDTRRPPTGEFAALGFPCFR